MLHQTGQCNAYTKQSNVQWTMCNTVSGKRPCCVFRAICVCCVSHAAHCTRCCVAACTLALQPQYSSSVPQACDGCGLLRPILEPCPGRSRTPGSSGTAHNRFACTRSCTHPAVLPDTQAQANTQADGRTRCKHMSSSASWCAGLQHGILCCNTPAVAPPRPRRARRRTRALAAARTSGRTTLASPPSLPAVRTELPWAAHPSNDAALGRQHDRSPSGSHTP
jgi:hypothetical protein